MRTRIGLAGSIALAVLAMLALAAGVALGHAKLESSDPEAGATIPSPYTVTATFDEELTPTGSSIVIQNSAGAQVASGTVSTTDDKTMIAELPQVPDGQYEVLWTAVTADDNAVERGTYTFTVGVPVASVSATSAPSTTGAPTTPPPSSPPTSIPIDDSGASISVAVVAALVVVLAIAGFFIYRNRR